MTSLRGNLMGRSAYLIAVLGLLSSVISPAGAQEKFSLEALKPLVGQWNGELEYLDYRDNKTRVVLRAALDARISMLKEHLVLNFIYQEPGYKLERLEIISYDEKEAALLVTGIERGKSTSKKWQVSEFATDTSTSSVAMVLMSSEYDENKLAQVRRTLTLTPANLILLKEVKHEGGKFFFRNEVRLQRWGR